MSNENGNFNILAIDTAMAGCNVGVMRGFDAMIFSSSQEMAHGQSEVLLPMIENALAEAKLSFKDLHAIVITVGPGAFTGLRIGLSTACALGLALGISVCGVTTMEVLAHQYEGEKPCTVLLETKRQDYYVQVFDADKAPLTEPAVLSGKQVLGLLSEYSNCVLIGDAVSRYEAEGFLTVKSPLEVVLNIKVPDPETMIHMGKEQLLTDKIISPVPLYLRGADVSERKTPLRKLEKSV